MLEIFRSRPLFLHPAPHPLDRDNNLGERVPSEPWRLRAGCLDGVLVHRTVLHKTVLHRDSRSRRHWKVLGYSLGAAVRFRVFLHSAPALPLEAVSDKSGFEVALLDELAPKA
jgi:hypothetical protein